LIIDLHTHAFPEKIAQKTMEKLAEVAQSPYYGDGTAEAVTENLKKSGADKAVILTIATRPDNIEKINNYAMECDGIISKDARYRDHIRFCSVHPKAPNAIDELVRLKSLGVKGVKFHPDYQDFMIDDPALYPIYEAVAELGLIAVFHAGFDPLSPDLIHAPPDASARVLRDHPRMKTVLAHLGGMKQFGEVRELLAGRFDNLYLDTALISRYISQADAAEIIRLQGADKVLFGSDFPWSETLTEMRFIEGLPLSREEKDMILGENAVRLLGLEH